jgi:hypothetical protein
VKTEDDDSYDLQLDRLSFQFDRSDLEIDTDGRDVRFSVGVVGESKQQTRLSDTGITDQKEFCYTIGECDQR